LKKLGKIVVSFDQVELLHCPINLDHLYVEAISSILCQLGFVRAIGIGTRLRTIDIDILRSLHGEGIVKVVNESVNGLNELLLIEVVPVIVFVSLTELEVNLFADRGISIVELDRFTGVTARGNEEDLRGEDLLEDFVDLAVDSPHTNGSVGSEGRFEIRCKVGSDDFMHNGISLY
jgi:hypothetical protein